MRHLDKMEKYKQFGFKRNIDYIRINFFIMWKNLTEYKTNFYSSFVAELFYLSVMFIFYYVLSDNFASAIPWKTSDFFVYIILTSVMTTLSGLLLWKNTLFYVLKKGDLNSYLIRPINPNIFFVFSKIAPQAFVMLFIDSLLFVIGVVCFNIVLYNVVLSLFCFILVIILHIVFNFWIFSLDMLKMGISSTTFPIVDKLDNMIEQYPAPFFEKSNGKFLGLFVPIFFISSLVIPLIRGYDTMFSIKLQILILIVLICSFFVGIVINWKYGLKRYEGFG